MFPSDLNYHPTEISSEDSASSPLFRHKLCCLRQELVEAFVDHKYIEFVRHAALQIQQLTANQAKTAADEASSSSDLEKAKELIKQLTTAETEAAAATAADTETANNARVIEDACRHVGSWKSTEFDIRFHPNLYQPHVKLGVEDVSRDVKLLREAADFLLNTQLPQFVRELQEHSVLVADGPMLGELMHARGINLRYLGRILKQLKGDETQAPISSVDYIYSIGLNELVARSAKRVFRAYVQNVPNAALAQAISHFLNCYLSLYVKPVASSAASVTTAAPTQQQQHALNTSPPPSVNSTVSELAKKKKKNQKGKGSGGKSNGLMAESNEWTTLTHRSLWTQIREESLAQYGFELKVSCRL